jgi:hypothetical protein
MFQNKSDAEYLRVDLQISLDQQLGWIQHVKLTRIDKKN